MAEHYQKEEYDGRRFILTRGFAVAVADAAHVSRDKLDPECERKYYVQQMSAVEIEKMGQTKKMEDDSSGGGVGGAGGGNGSGVGGTGTQGTKRIKGGNWMSGSNDNDLFRAFATLPPCHGDGEGDRAGNRSSSRTMCQLKRNVTGNRNDENVLVVPLAANCGGRQEATQACSPVSMPTVPPEVRCSLADITAAPGAKEGARGKEEADTDVGCSVEFSPVLATRPWVHGAPVTGLQGHEDNQTRGNMVKSEEEGTTDFCEELIGDVGRPIGGEVEDGAAAVTEWQPPALAEFTTPPNSSTKAVALMMGGDGLSSSERVKMEVLAVPSCATSLPKRRDMAVLLPSGFTDSLGLSHESPFLAGTDVIGGDREEKEEEEEKVETSVAHFTPLVSRGSPGECRRRMQLSPELQELMNATRLRSVPNQTPSVLTDTCGALLRPLEGKEGKEKDGKKRSKTLARGVAGRTLIVDKADSVDGSLQLPKGRQYTTGVVAAEKDKAIVARKTFGLKAKGPSMSSSSPPPPPSPRSPRCVSARSVMAARAKPVLTPYTKSFSYVLQKEARRKCLCYDVDADVGVRTRIPDGEPRGATASSTRQASPLTVAGRGTSSSLSPSPAAAAGKGGMTSCEREPTALEEVPKQMPFFVSTSTFVCTPEKKEAWVHRGQGWEVEEENTTPLQVRSSTASSHVGRHVQAGLGTGLPKGRASDTAVSGAYGMEKTPDCGFSLPPTPRRWSENPVYEIAAHAPSRRNSTRAPSEASVGAAPPIEPSSRRDGLSTAALLCGDDEWATQAKMDVMSASTETVEPVMGADVEVTRCGALTSLSQRCHRQLLPFPSHLDEEFGAAALRFQSNGSDSNVLAQQKPHCDRQCDAQNPTKRVPSHGAPRVAIVEDLVRRACETPAQREAVVAKYLRPDEQLLWRSLKETLTSLQLRSADFARQMSEWDAQHPVVSSDTQKKLQLVRTKKKLAAAEWEYVEKSCWKYFRAQLVQGGKDPLGVALLQRLWQAP